MACPNRVEVTAGFCILWALMILMLPLKFLVAAALAALFHEICHALAVKLMGGRILGMTLDAGGLSMEVSDLNGWQELICALAGPGGSFLLAMAPIPTVRICAVVQGLFNLIPLTPLDGGRALGCTLDLVVPGYREQIRRGVEVVVLLGFLVLIPALELGMGAFACWMALAMRKFPCKEGRKAVQ